MKKNRLFQETGEMILEHSKHEQPIVHLLLKCSLEIGRKEKYKDRVGLLGVVSGITTVISMLYYLISPSTTYVPLVIFSIITAIGYFTLYIIRQEIFRLHQKYYSLKKDLQAVRQKVIEQRRTE